MMPFPNIDPVIFTLGPFALRWYALAYIAGIFLGIAYAARLANTPRLWPHGAPLESRDIWDWTAGATFGTIIGGRLGYALFYNPEYYLTHPAEIAAVWQGGMSFHGGLAGVGVAFFIFAKRRGLPLLSFGDVIAAATPMGLFFGRLANFINGELWGRITDAPWGVVFPTGGALPRHPSQLYEAGLEGLGLFALLNWLIWRRNALARPGLVFGMFLAGYGAARLWVEQFRAPDAHLGFIFGEATMGQLLSLPMVLGGLALAVVALMRRNAP